MDWTLFCTNIWSNVIGIISFVTVIVVIICHVNCEIRLFWLNIQCWQDIILQVSILISTTIRPQFLSCISISCSNPTAYFLLQVVGNASFYFCLHITMIRSWWVVPLLLESLLCHMVEEKHRFGLDNMIRDSCCSNHGLFQFTKLDRSLCTFVGFFGGIFCWVQPSIHCATMVGARSPTRLKGVR